MAGDGDAAARPTAELHNPTLGGGELFREEIKLESGGGGAYDPQTPAEVQRRLGGRAADLAREAEERSEAEMGSSGRVIVEAKVLPNYLAASHTPNALIGACGMAIVGSRPARGEYRTERRVERDAPAKVYLLSGTPANAGTFAEFLQESARVPDTAYQEIRQLEDVKLGGPETIVAIDRNSIELDDDGRALLEAVMHPQIGDAGTGDELAQDRNVEAFTDYVTALDNGARVSAVAIEDGVAFLSVTVERTAIPALARFTQLRVLRPLTTVREPPLDAHSDNWDLDGISTTVTTSADRIAVFDGGLSSELETMLGDLVTFSDLTSGQAILPSHERHGGWVVSSALFGHLDPEHPRPTAGVPVDAYRIWPPPRDVRRDEELHWVLDRISEVLQRGRHRIAVITLAPKMNVDHRAEPHRWTAVVDRITREHDVLICVAGGNTGDLAPSADRLLIPADAINAVSVGAATTATGLTVRADYSSIGPGRPGQTTAPTGVQFGGDVSAGLPFYALGPDGRAQAVNGTSIAAPAVARACALLREALGDQADANLLRCLAAHGAERVVGRAKGQPGSTAREVGLGRLPADLVSQLEHEDDVVTVVFRDAISRGQQIALQFPFPDDLFEDYHNKQFRLHWTFSFMPPIETSNPVDYAAAGFDVLYRPHAQTFTLRDPDDATKVFKINRLLEGPRFDYEISQGLIQSARPATSHKPGWVTEVESRARDGKWETIIRVDTRPAGTALYRPGIDLRLLTRTAGSLLHEPVPMPFALAVTLRGPKGSDVYRRVQQYAPALTPLVATIPVSIHASVNA
jgi:Subtilase family